MGVLYVCIYIYIYIYTHTHTHTHTTKWSDLHIVCLILPYLFSFPDELEKLQKSKQSGNFHSDTLSSETSQPAAPPLITKVGMSLEEHAGYQGDLGRSDIDHVEDTEGRHLTDTLLPRLFPLPEILPKLPPRPQLHLRRSSSSR